MRNTVALGASVAVMGGPFEKLSSVIHDQFIRKGQEVVDKNIAIAKAGFDYVRSHYGSDVSFHLEPGTHTDTLAVVNGSEALGLGAVRAGLKFAAIYPMTPINALITFLADHAKELGVVYKQPEDEVAGINMALGASVGGVRSMVATSGGGFDLMTEGLSLAGMIETPLVVDLGMRTGPATGMPTYTEQGDLMLAIHAGHGEFPRIVLAPGDARETFEMTIEAFNLADRYQTQVIILTDKYLNESHWTIPLEPLNKAAGIDRGKLVTGGLPAEPVFMRYADTPDGVSPRSVPGTPNGIFVANSYEHDESGHVTDKRQARKAMVDKRMRKFSGIMKAARPPVYTGDEHPDVLLVTWGTTQGPVLDAVELLRRQGTSAAALCYTWMYPFPAEASLDMLKRCARVVDIELNATGQLARLVREQTGFDIREKILRYDGRTLTPEEIVEKLR